MSYDAWKLAAPPEYLPKRKPPPPDWALLRRLVAESRTEKEPK